MVRWLGLGYGSALTLANPNPNPNPNLEGAALVEQREEAGVWPREGVDAALVVVVRDVRVRVRVRLRVTLTLTLTWLSWYATLGLELGLG